MAKDEAYIIDTCDRVLDRKASRQHRFAVLLGDTRTRLPVDAYYEDLALAVEYRERQHLEPVALWDKKPTASGIPRGRQRALYDERRRKVLPQHGIMLVEFSHSDFKCDSRKRLLRVSEEFRVRRLEEYRVGGSGEKMELRIPLPKTPDGNRWRPRSGWT